MESVKTGELDEGYWHREEYGAELKRDRVTIYFMDEENYVICLDKFEKALRAWADFMKSEPDIDEVQIVDLGD